MRRLAPLYAIVLLVVVAYSPAASAAQADRPRRAYKPSERRQQKAEAQPSQASDPQPEEKTAGTTYEQELEAAKEKRARDLQEAAATETSRRKLEERKSQIFAQYAAIIAALKDKYEAAHGPQDPPAAKPGKTKPKAGRQKPAKSRDPAAALAEAQENLDAENARHEAKMDQLNGQLERAESSGNRRSIQRVRKAIDKENNSYNARKAILERRVEDLGGSPTPTADDKR
jgi:hypothetical protein